MVDVLVIFDTTAVIDRDGRIAYRDGSPTPRQTHLAVLETLKRLAR